MISLPTSQNGIGKSTSNESALNFAFFSFVFFLCFEAVFALIANSQSMLADAEAMSVDAFTYLFNLCAERIKNRPFTAAEQELPSSVRDYRRELRRLYSELFPPAISVATLIVVTILTLREALSTLYGNEKEGEDEVVSAMIMIVFSAANLLLDIVNISCFSRAKSTYGLDLVRRGGISISMGAQEVYRRANYTPHTNSTSALHHSSQHSIDEHSCQHTYAASEDTGLLCRNDESVNRKLWRKEENGDENEWDNSLISSSQRPTRFSSSRLTPISPHELVNLNMCSAWTHVCADTMRSTAVLVAAGLSYLIPAFEPAMADAVAAVIVSVIILVSLFPILQGLCLTAIQICSLSFDPPNPDDENFDEEGSTQKQQAAEGEQKVNRSTEPVLR